MRARHLIILFILAGMSLVLAGCGAVTSISTQVAQGAGVISEQEGDSLRRVGHAAIKSFEDLTPEQEYYIGRAVAASILEKYPALDNDPANEYLNLLGQTLAMASDRPETFGGYHFLLLDSDEINAFAAPGGLIMVTRGMVACCGTEDELAAVLAHEIGHVQNQDGLRAISKSRWTSLAAIGLEEGMRNLGSEDLQAVAESFSGCIDDIAQTLVVNGYARSQEKAADAAAVTILERVGYAPEALGGMLETMGERWDPSGPGFARTHPSPGDRLKSVGVPALRCWAGGAARSPSDPVRASRGQPVRTTRGAPVKRQAIIHSISIGVAASAVALLLWSVQALDTFESSVWDWRVQTFAAPGPQSEQVVMVLLDQSSLDWGEEVNGLTWPWPREVYSLLIQFCTDAGAATVAFDVLFTESSGFGVEDDLVLATAIADNGKFVGARFLALDGTGGAKRDDLPIEEVATAARLLANVSDAPDGDGVFRHAGLWVVHGGELVPSLGAGAWLVGQDIAADEYEERLRAASPEPDGKVLLRYRGTDAYPTYNAAEIIQAALRQLEGLPSPVSPTEFSGKHVLFGFSAPGLLDLRSTPVSKVSPGVFVHATALDNLLGADFLRRAPGWSVWLGTILLALLMALFTVGSGTKAAPLLVLAAVAVPLGWGFAAYSPGWWVPVVPGALAAVVAVFGGLIRNYAFEGRQKRFIKAAFKHYLSPAVIEGILAEPGALKLGGERRELTIMFSDLAGFTSLSEGLTPEELTALLNDYLTDMTDIILEEGGTLDKYEGDAIMAFWNAPLDQPDHAARACRAAVRCQRKLDDRRAEFRERCGVDLHQRLGLHTGQVVVGNMGSRQRFDYTVLGDAANLASRLEGANKFFASETMISEDTLAQAADFRCRPLGPLQVVGRAEPVEVFELQGLPGDPEEPGNAEFATALTRWREGQAAEAAALFAARADDPVAQRLAEICQGEESVLLNDRRVWRPGRK
jgi:adenylate cyclase